MPQAGSIDVKRAKKMPNPVPRNPLVVPAKFRKAGAHRKSEKALRRAGKVKAAQQAFDTD